MQVSSKLMLIVQNQLKQKEDIKLQENAFIIKELENPTQ